MRHWPATRWADRLAMVGLYVFSFYAWMPHQGAYAGVGLIAFACALDARRVWAAVQRLPVVWLALLSIGYILLRAALVAVAEPDAAHLHWHDAMRLSALCLFPLLAWSVAGDQRRIIIALSLALAGFLVGFFLLL